MLSYHEYLMISFERYLSHFSLHVNTSRQCSSNLLFIPDVDYRFRDFNDARFIRKQTITMMKY